MMASLSHNTSSKEKQLDRLLLPILLQLFADLPVPLVRLLLLRGEVARTRSHLFYQLRHWSLAAGG